MWWMYKVGEHGIVTDQKKECLETDASAQVSEQMGSANDDVSDSDVVTYDIEMIRQ